MRNEIATIDELYRNKSVAISTALAQAREKTSLLESKIELLAIYKMNEQMYTVDKVDAAGNPYQVHAVTINTPEIRRLTGRSGASLYRDLFNASLELKRKIYIYIAPGETSYRMDNLYGAVEYKEGKLTIEYNPATEFLFSSLRDNFTKIRLDIAFSFKTNGGFQLYKLLRSYAYTLAPVDYSLSQEEQEICAKQYSLSELRMQLGYVDLSQKEIQEEARKKNPDPEKLDVLEKKGKPRYKRWVDFYNRVIAPGIEEINKISDIYIASVKKECGVHGKVETIMIRFQRNVAFHENEVQRKKPMPKVSVQFSEDEIDDAIDQIRKIVGDKLSTKECRHIATVAGCDIDIVKKAWDYLMSQEHEIVSPFKYLENVIKNRYWESAFVPTPKKKPDHGFTERVYDFSEFES